MLDEVSGRTPNNLYFRASSARPARVSSRYFANMVRIDLVFKPDHHMVLEYAVRIRDLRGIVDDKLLAAPMEELQVFEPMPYAPM